MTGKRRKTERQPVQCVLSLITCNSQITIRKHGTVLNGIGKWVIFRTLFSFFFLPLFFFLLFLFFSFLHFIEFLLISQVVAERASAHERPLKAHTNIEVELIGKALVGARTLFHLF